LPRRVARFSRSDEAPADGAVTVVKGSIRTPDDPSALEVKLSIWATEITMRADGSELGNWPVDAVTIRPIDTFSYEFAAEGDRLIFMPDNPDQFGQLPIVDSGSAKRRKRRRKAKPVEQAPPVLRWDETTEAEEQLRKRQASRGKEASGGTARDPREESVKEPRRPIAKRAAPAKPRRRERKAASATASADVGANPETAAAETAEDWTQHFGAVETPRRSVEALPSAAPTEAVVSARSEPAADRETFRHRVWMGTIDFARRYDLFGLDRVQVTAELRSDPNHAHSWNSRVAPTTGPGRYICTICGAIRRDGG